MNRQITNIVFTKNRPLQLDAYLESLYRHFPQELFQTYVLYKPEFFGEQYQQLFKKFPNCKVIEEKDFSNDFFSILNETNTEYILFGVDDVIYFDSVDFDLIDETFKQFPKDIFGFSLKYNLDNTMHMNSIAELTVFTQDIYKMNWPLIREYPFELCATIYRTELVKKIIKNSRKNNSLCENLFAPNSITIRVLSKIIRRHKILKRFGYFYNPNTLESWNCRWCQRNCDQLPTFLYFQKLCASAVQVNMVNTSTNNTWDGAMEHTVGSVNDKYKEGYRVDIDFICNNKPKSGHCGRERFKLIKK